MKRLHLIAITSLLTLVFIVWQAPASLIGLALQQASHHTWDLADANGTLWNGRGVITTGQRDKDPRPVSLPPMGWKLVGFQGGGLLFQMQAHGQAIGHLQVGLGGWRTQLRELGLEARDLTPVLPGLLSKGDWQGFLNFHQMSAQGSWRSVQTAEVDVEWLHAATGLIPQGELGSFVLKGHTENAGVSFSITSQDGPLVIAGQGSHSRQQGFQFTGELTDNAGLASQFPGFLSAYLQPAGAPNRYTLHISQLDL